MKRRTAIALGGVACLLIGLGVGGWLEYRDYRDTTTALSFASGCPKILDVLGAPWKLQRSCPAPARTERCVILEGPQGRGEYHWSVGTRPGLGHDILGMWFIPAKGGRVDVLACVSEYLERQMEVRNEIEDRKVDCADGDADVCDHIADLLDGSRWLPPDPGLAAQYRAKARALRAAKSR